MKLSLHRDMQTRENTGSALPPSSSSTWPVAGTRSLTIVALVLLMLGLGASRAHAQAWSLTKEQRQAYLHYYAPVILQRADGNNGKQGRDWITNFDFDQNGDFSNNRVNCADSSAYSLFLNRSAAMRDGWRHMELY